MTRIVLLGASNVTLGFGVITRLLRAGFDGPLDVRAALGHGRSYGAWSTIAVRSLPAISDCGLWTSLRHNDPAETYALLTDVGNDLMYGYRPEMIAGWVEACLDRLTAARAKIVVTQLPIARIEQLGSLRYHATRMSFFPRHRPIRWPEMLDRARTLNTLVASAATERGAAVVIPARDWYGFDPIHIRWTRRLDAWSEIASAWPGFRRPVGRITSSSISLLGRFPEYSRLFGRELSAMQPVASRDETVLSLY